jgi:NACHT domain
MSQCLHDLRVTDPDADMDRIESTKDALLKDCYAWILDDQDLQYWQNNDNCRLLWMNGDPGKGKTMLMIALVRELLQRSVDGSATLAFFFCQSTEPTLNTATSVLRSLIWKLVHNNSHLAADLLQKYKGAGKQLFEGANATFSMFSILSKILEDAAPPKVYLLIDALDECETGRDQLLQFITKNASDPSSKAKWLLSSRNYLEIKELRDLQNDRRILNLELNSSHVSRAVDAFIEYKTSELARLKSYSNALQLEVKRQLNEKAGSTFLWVALACKRLECVSRRRTLSVLTEFPPGLQPLYDRMMDQLLHLEVEDRELCTRILCSVVVAYRPLILEELVVMAQLPQDLLDDIESLSELVELCGSFIRLRERTTYFVHQSAKDYFVGSGQRIFPSSIRDEHWAIAHLSLEIMSNELRRDICNIRKVGKLRSEIAKEIITDHITPYLNYACLYWVLHLQQSQKRISDGDGVYDFLHGHFLHWLEAMSLIGQISESISLIRILDSLIAVSYLMHLSAYLC